MLVLLKRLYRIGPVILLLIVVLWAIAHFFVTGGEESNQWSVYFASIFLLLFWHLVLLCQEETAIKRQLIYALWHIPLFVYVAFQVMGFAKLLPL